MTGLVISNLSAGYKRRPVVEDLSLSSVAPGSMLGLLGPNASGKSTLLRAIAGLGASSGRVELNGVDLKTVDSRKRVEKIGYLPQSLPPASPLVAYEAVMAACRAVRALDTRTAEQVVENAFAGLGINHLALERMSRLSGGQRQMVGLAQVVVRTPELLLLDEPTSALDLKWQLAVINTVREILRKTGAIAMIAIHDINLAIRTCDQLAVISEGSLIAFGPTESAISPTVISRAYGVTARVEHCSEGIPFVLVDHAAS